MPSSHSEARARVALLAVMALPAWACATAIDNALPDSNPLANHSAAGSHTAGSAASAGIGASAGKTGTTGAAGNGASGAHPSGGAPGSSGGTAGKGTTIHLDRGSIVVDGDTLEVAGKMTAAAGDPVIDAYRRKLSMALF